MNSLRLIQGNKNGISLHEQIKQQLSSLREHNKKYCLELIMNLDPEERLLFLNAYVVAVATLPVNTNEEAA